MISQSRAHLRAADERYWRHFRFASTFGLLAMAAGIAALIHAVIPALCTSTASRTVRLLALLADDRGRIDEIEARSVEAKAFVMLLILATIVVAPLWVLSAPSPLRMAYTILAYALPAAMLFTNPDLVSLAESPA
jgi:hypothetical protein